MRRLVYLAERKFNAHIIVFRLTNLAEGEQLDLVYARILSEDLLQREHILAVVVDRGNDDLTDGDGDMLFIQIREKIQRRLHGATDVFSVERFARVLDIEQNAVGFL